MREKLSIDPTTIVEKTKSSSFRPKFGREAMSPITQAPTPIISSVTTLKGNCGSAPTLSFHPLRKALKIPASPTETPLSFPSSSSPLPPPFSAIRIRLLPYTFSDTTLHCCWVGIKGIRNKLGFSSEQSNLPVFSVNLSVVQQKFFMFLRTYQAPIT